MTDGLDYVGSEATLLAVVLAVVVLTETLCQWVVVNVLGLGFDPIGFVLVALAIVVGRAARLGSVLGLLVVGVLLGDWSGGVIQAAAGFVATTVAIRLWVHRDGSGRVGLPEWLLRYGVAATVAVLAFAATSAWLSDVLDRAAFGVTIGRTVGTTLLPALLGAPLVRLVAGQASEHPSRTPGNPTTGRSRVLLVTTVVFWILGGYVGSYLFRALALAPPGAVGRRISPLFEALVVLWGRQGTYAQFVLGLAAVIVITIGVRRD